MKLIKPITNPVVVDINPNIPVNKPSNIEIGITGSTNILTGIETSDISPVIYNKSGKTNICVEIVAVANPRSSNL